MTGWFGSGNNFHGLGWV